ncbi:MAG TPA: HAD family hydrolase [Candidatus Hydrogenedentes bacterium]|nr:HAD family hydrolase [Candidatus Hydrogenedentota bacterium]
MSEKVQAVLFDFDYTLGDSSTGIVNCINYALGQIGLAPVSAERARATIGLSLRDALEHLAGAQPEETHERFTEAFVALADKIMADLTVVYESTAPTIAWLREQGFRLGIVTTKYGYRIDAILGRAGFLDAFEFVIGGDHITRHKPDPECLRLALERLRLSPGQVVVYVGDSWVDAETAQGAGVPFVAVLTGVTKRDEFDVYEVLAIIEDLSELPFVLGQSPQAGRSIP